MRSDDIMQSMYEVRDTDRVPFGTHWCGPAAFPHAQWVLVAKYAPASDGRHVCVWAEAWPARFYRVVVLPSGARPRFEIGTGSDGAKQAAAIATDLARGMLGVKFDEPWGGRAIHPILAGLRLLEAALAAGTLDPAIADVLTNGGTVAAMDPEEVGLLCETLNTR